MHKLREIHILVIVLIVIFGGIGIFMATGDWATESSKVPAKFSSGELEGEYNPEDIRGSYTFEEIATLFEIPDDVLRRAFNIPEDVATSDFKSKDLETIYEDVEIGNDSIKAFVATYLGISYDLSEVVMPDEAVEILLNQYPDYDETMKETVNAMRLSLHLGGDETSSESDIETSPESSEASTTQESVIEENAAGSPEEEEHTEASVNGNTTFMQVLNAGVSESEIQEIIGGDIPNTAMTVKDYCIDKGLSFSTVKTALSDLMAETSQ